LISVLSKTNINISSNKVVENESIVNAKKEYEFLSPHYQDINQTSIEKTNSLKSKIDEIADENKNIKFSVFFRDLNNGPWFNYNSLETFDGASLLKMPVMITYLKAQETSDILKNNVFYETEFPESEYEFDQTLNVGETYNIEYLLKIMIQKSDNTAKSILVAAADQLKINPDITETSELIGLLNNYNPNEVTTDQYAGVFRILYNSEYLSPEMSEKALDILSKTDYKNGLVKYLPSDLKVSHKYGIRYYTDKLDYQVHDCGIVYSQNPYIICVMSLGQDKQNQEELIAKIAKASFDLLN
jgi:beta-lactamase class A